ncbi:MAG: hypothetical protein NUV97_03835 [archaeon]|nr:hypothetical protein [archaeon]MCR4323851.1 hypothetical protein [Nanoarchaeota archaeon]
MEKKEFFKRLFLWLIASIVLSFSVAFRTTNLVYKVFLIFLVIIGANILAKKIVGYYFETNVKIGFWSIYQFWFRGDSHFKKPVPMIWLPLLLTLFTKGAIWWLAILEFDVEAKTERVSRRHGLYRFTEVTEWHIAMIAMWGIIVNLLLAIGGYLLGFELFTKLSIYFVVWSLIPLSSLDGSKILFSNRGLWMVLAVIAAVFLRWGIVL